MQKSLGHDYNALLKKQIGDTQKGFVHDRHMMKTVMMMLAVLATAQNEQDVTAQKVG